MTSHEAAELGRGVVVLPGDEPPLSWASARGSSLTTPRWRIRPRRRRSFHGYGFTRRPVVVELGVDPAALRAPEHCGRPVYELTPHFEFSRERLQFLVWANNYDARSGFHLVARSQSGRGRRGAGRSRSGSRV